MNESKSTDNCYMWSPSDGNHLQSYLISKIIETKLWHKNLGPLNLRSMRKIIVEKTILGILDLKIE